MKAKLTKFYDALVVITFILGVPLLGYFYFIDGIYINKILTFHDGVDPMNFKLEKTEYKKGEMVVGYTSVVKNREAKCYVNWSLVNSIVLPFSLEEDEIKELPPGHYQGRFEIKEIPNNSFITLGKHYLTGVQHCFLSGGRERIATFKTEEFNVIK